jgi:hypothetical protein
MISDRQAVSLMASTQFSAGLQAGRQLDDTTMLVMLLLEAVFRL